MNLILKAKIIENYGGQWKFAAAMNEHEASVSRVVRERKTLDEDKKAQWAKALGCKIEDLWKSDD